LPEPEPVGEVVEPELPEPEPVGEVVEPELPEPEPVGEAVEPERLEPDPINEEIEPEAPQPEDIQEEVVPEASKSVDETIVEDAASEAPVVDEAIPKDEGSGQEAPPSPNLSKTSSSSSRKNKTHWERKHADNVLKDVFADQSIVLEKSKKGGKGEVRVRDRGHKSHRVSSPEEDEARRRRRALRKEQEAARLVEEERRKLEEDNLRRIRRDERRAARKAEAEFEEKIKRLREEEEILRAKQREDEARRKRHRDRPSSSAQREVKDTGLALKLPALALPKALDFANAQSYHGKPQRHAEEVPSPTTSRQKETGPHEPPKDASKDEGVRPSSPSGGKSHRRHRHHHRSASDKSSRGQRDSDNRSRRHVEVEDDRPKTLFGMLRLR
jgi:hypothetical protein